MLKGEFLRRGDRFLTYTTKPKTFRHFNKYQNKKKLQWKVCSTAALVQYLLFLCGLLAAGFIFLYTHIYTYIYIHTYRHTYMHTCIHAYIHTYIVKETKRTHRFSVTLSFAPKRSSDRTLFNEEHTSLYTNWMSS